MVAAIKTGAADKGPSNQAAVPEGERRPTHEHPDQCELHTEEDSGDAVVHITSCGKHPLGSIRHAATRCVGGAAVSALTGGKGACTSAGRGRMRPDPAQLSDLPRRCRASAFPVNRYVSSSSRSSLSLSRSITGAAGSGTGGVCAPTRRSAGVSDGAASRPAPLRFQQINKSTRRQLCPGYLPRPPPGYPATAR